MPGSGYLGPDHESDRYSLTGLSIRKGKVGVTITDDFKVVPSNTRYFGNSFYKKNNKFNAIRSKCSLGHAHRSRLESQYCFKLTILKKQKEIQSFEFEKQFELRVNGKKIACHKPDFLVTNKQGKVEIHETKGMESHYWRIIKKLMEALYPEIPYIVIK